MAASASSLQRGVNPVAKLVAAGWQHTVLASDAGFYGFGTGANGELGHELGFVKFAAVKLKLPLAVPIEKGNTQVAVGSKHTLILTDGDVFSTGSPDDGRLGHTDLHGVVPLPEKIRFITCGSDHSVAISKSGLNLYAWGLCGKYGEGLAADEGVEMKREARLTPSLFRIIEPLSRTAKLVEQIACGSQHTIALCEDGQVYSWGCGKHGRLGHGGVADYTEPKLVSRFVLSPEQSIVQVAAGDSHSMALDKEGRVFSWGSGSYGRLGSGQELDQYIPTQVQGKLKGVYAISISCNAFHSLAVTRASGSKAANTVTLYTWGGGKYGKLGLDSERNQLSPQAVIFQGQNRQVIKAVCGLHHTVAVMQDSSVYAFGYGGGSRCGVEVEDLVIRTPREINFLRDAGIYKRYQLPKGDMMTKKYRADMVTTGEAHTLTLADKGEVVLAWGDNSSGQLGCGQMELSARPIPVFSTFATARVIAVACGSAFSMALTNIGAVWTWGNNKEGQLGLGDTENRSTPELVKALQGTFIHAIAAGHFHSSAIQYGYNFEGREIGAAAAAAIPAADRKNNKIYVWGQNTEGQLGIGKEAVLRQLFPAPLQLKEKWDRVEMALGRTHSLILGKDFEEADVNRVEKSMVYACGKGTSGQLGIVADLGQKHYRPKAVEIWESDTKVKKASTPTPIDTRIRSIAAGETSSMAVEYDNDTEILWAWGNVPGLWESQRLTPTEIKQLMPASRFVGSTIKATLEQELEAKKPIYKLRIPQVSCGKTHFMVLLNYNNDNNVVFTWGDTRYGKLGHGQIPEFHEQRAANRKKITGSNVDEKTAETDNKDSNLVGPAVISAFLSQDISQVSCFADHSLALSSKEGAELEGSVWSWGYGAAGRLGLDDATSKSEMKPRVIPFFGKTLGLMADDSKSEEAPPAFAAAASGVIGPDGIALGIRDTDVLARAAEAEAKEKREHRRQQDLEDEPIIFSEEDDRKARAANLEAEKPLEQHRKHSIRYLELLSKLERQKMLVFKAIVRRVDASQGKRSLTQRKRKALKKNKEMIMKQRIKEAQDRQRAILAEGGPGAEEKAAAIEELGPKQGFIPGFAGGHSDIREDEKDAESGFAKGLSEMELLLTRLYMRPCFMFTVFNLYSEHINKLKSNKTLANEPKIPSSRRTDIRQALMDDFSDLLVNVWDTWTDADIRLTQTFLRMMFAQHVNDRIEDVLSPETLEWAVMIRIMRCGRVWSKLSSLCNSLLDEMPAWDGDTPAKRLQSFQDNRNLDELNMALKQIHEHGEKLVLALQKPERRSQMIEAVGWCTEVFYEAIEKADQHPIALYGRRIIALIIEFMIEDHGRRRRMKDSAKIEQLRREAKKKPTSTDARTNKTIEQLVKMKQAAGSELLVLYHLKQRAHSTDAIRSEVLKEFMIEHYGIDPAALGFTTDEETGERKTAPGDDVPVLPFSDDELTPWTKQVTELLKSRKSFDPRLGVHDMEKVDAEQELFKDFLLMRSRQKRRIIRITVSTEHLLSNYKNYITDINPEKPRATIRMVGHFTKRNHQVDPFAADFKGGVDAKLVNASQCVKCGLLHAPLVSYEKKDGDEDKGAERKEDDRKGVKESKTVILVEAECLTLFQAIKGQKYRKLLQNTSGEETWRALLDQLQDHRAFHMKGGNFEKAHVYEKAFSTMRKLKDKRDDKRVLTNLVFGENSAVPVTCKADDITPIFLMKTLEELNNADQKMKRLAGRKVENISKVVKQLEEEVFDAYDMFDDMKKQYRKVTAASDRSLKELGIPKAKIERHQEIAYLAQLRPQGEVKVHLDQGVVKRYKYKNLVDIGLLYPNDRDPSREGWMPFACFRCLRCCLDPVDEQQIRFLAGVTFVFSTTDADGIFQLNLGYQAKGNASSSLLTQNVALQELAPNPEDDPDDPKPYNMRYDPTGDNVPVQKRQIFRFDKAELHTLLKALPIPVRKFTLEAAPPA